MVLLILWSIFLFTFLVYIIYRTIFINKFSLRFKKYKDRTPVTVCTLCGTDSKIESIERPYVYKKWCNVCNKATTHVRVFFHYYPEDGTLFIEIPMLKSMSTKGVTWSTRAIKISDMDGYLFISRDLSNLFKDTNKVFFKGNWE